MSTDQAPKTHKRDHLIHLEGIYQKGWQESKVNEVDAPRDHEDWTGDRLRAKYPKFFANAPFPYMNGALHLGHGYSYSKAEFAVGYERMKGKRALWPFAFHVTGMPIAACADKLKREIEMFGPDFDLSKHEETKGKTEPPAEAQTETSSATVTSAPSNLHQVNGNGPSAVPAAAAPIDPVKAVGTSKKSKAAAKSTGLQYQFQIMRLLGLEDKEIVKFSDAQQWLRYFPPITITDLNALGCRIDWRRSFITTDANPYYDSFVRWQMNLLKKMNKIKFGKRYTIFSPKDGQPCMDHDRASGEGIGPQEYTGIMMEVLSWPEAVNEHIKSSIGGQKVYMVAATLRPETMYGQTNCFVGTTIKYGIFKGRVGDRECLFLCTERAARNMCYQGLSMTPDKVEQVASVQGKDLVGALIHAPISQMEKVRVLPMENVLATKGTGVVTSVPSDSPDDYATMRDLVKKAAYYNIDPAWADIEPIPVLETPTYGKLTAPALVEKLKINSQKDVKQLAEAKEIAYKEGFYQGVMVTGKYKGETVQVAKTKVRDEIIESGLGFIYNEPEGSVVSRSGEECVVALCDQYYLDYGEPEWRALAEKCLARMNLYSQDTRNSFEGMLAWLKQWACARSYGLGTRLPWDDAWLVESLSDSTIYMAYYTIAHLLQGGHIDGSQVGPSGIKVDHLTEEVWEHIFRDGPMPETDIPQDTLKLLKREFEYFYPFDIRSSAKDLIGNHLTFAIYNHVAIFPEEKWPLAMRCNGHLLLNGDKMSKSSGNFLTLRQAIELYGADATRVALADAGDGIEDANFEQSVANAAILRIHTLLEWCEEYAHKQDLRTGPCDSLYDRIFANEMNQLIEITTRHYEAAEYRDVLKNGFYELLIARDWYQQVCSTHDGLHRDLVNKYIRIQTLLIAPIAPHFSEHVWQKVLKENNSVLVAAFPKPDASVDIALVDTAVYVRSTIKVIRDAESAQIKKKAKGKKGTSSFNSALPKAIRIYVADKFPEWQDKVASIIRQHYDDKTGAIDESKILAEYQTSGMIKDKRVMPYNQIFKRRLAEQGPVAFTRTMSFDEVQVLQTISPFLKQTLGFESLDIVKAEDALKGVESGQLDSLAEAKIADAEPGKPTFVFWNVESRDMSS